MTRVFAHYASAETAGLGLLELVMSFLLLYVLLTLPGGAAVFGAAPVLAEHAMALAATLALANAAIAAAIGLYRPDVCLERRLIVMNALVAGLAAFPAVLLIGGGYRIELTAAAVLRLTGLLAACQLGGVVTHLAYSAVASRGGMVRRVLIIGSGRRAVRLAEMLRGQCGRPFEPVMVRADAAPATLATLRRQRIWGVVIATDGDAEQPPAALLDCKLRGVRVLSDTAFCETHLGRIDLDAIDANWMLCADGFTSGQLLDATKRGMDIVASLTLLVLTLPVIMLTSVLIRLDSPGPVFYRQQRIGLHGRPFSLLKFRSMAVDAEAAGKPRWAQQRDPRITRVGKFIRPMRIDELPQIINVLSGSMSIVGPRPERPQFVAELTRLIPFYRERCYAKPGITGWAQVNYPYGASVEDAREKLSYDLYYTKNRGLLIDILILLATVRVILFREGAR